MLDIPNMGETSKRSFDFLPLSIRLETLGGVATPLVLRGFEADMASYCDDYYADYYDGC